MSGRLPPFPVALNEADHKFLLLEHYVRHDDSGICPPCQDAILARFCILAERYRLGQQLRPCHLDPQHQTPQNAGRLDQARVNIITWRTQNKNAFSALLHNTWLAMFAPAKTTIDNERKSFQPQASPPGQPLPAPGRTPNNLFQSLIDVTLYETAADSAEEWLTKVWHACVGRYTAEDLVSGVPYTGNARSFENMQLRRLVALQRPTLGASCHCADRLLPAPPGSGLPTLGWLEAPPHEEVLMKYTDPVIRSIHARFCEELVARGEGQRVKPLARMIEDRRWRSKFLAAVDEVEAANKERKAREEAEQNRVLEAAGALLMLKNGQWDNEEEIIEDTIVVKIEPDSD